MRVRRRQRERRRVRLRRGISIPARNEGVKDSTLMLVKLTIMTQKSMQVEVNEIGISWKEKSLFLT